VHIQAKGTAIDLGSAHLDEKKEFVFEPAAGQVFSISYSAVSGSCPYFL